MKKVGCGPHEPKKGRWREKGRKTTRKDEGTAK